MTITQFDFQFSIAMSVYSFMLILLVILNINGYRMRMKKQFSITLTAVIIISFLLLSDFVYRYHLIINDMAFLDKRFITIVIILDVLEAIILALAIISLRFQSANYITGNSIKEGLDYLDGGLCYYNSQGRVLLANDKMTSLIEQLPDASIYNGFSIWSAIKQLNYEQLDFDTNDDIMIVKLAESFFKFAQNKKMINGHSIYEIVATDVTAQETLNKELIEENYQLESLNKRLLAYNYNVEKLIAEEEILNMKIKLHDNYGQLLLSANKSLEEHSSLSDRKENLTLWRNNLSLVTLQEDDNFFNNDFSELKKVAKSVGVDIHFANEVTINDKKLYDVFFTAIHEALTNTVAHANGHHLYVDFSIEKNEYQIVIKNDGKLPKSEIKYGGGLTNLQRKVASLNGSMKVSIKDMVTINILIPLEVNSYGR